MTALPPLSEVQRALDENGQSAWGMLLEAEKTALALSANAPGPKHNDLVVAVRVIGFFILDFKQNNRGISFAERAYRKLVQQVHSARDHKKIIELGSLLQNHLIRACMSRVLLSRNPISSPLLSPLQ